MHPVEQTYDDQHQEAIEVVEVYFVSQQVIIVALEVLHNTKSVSDHDPPGCNIQDVHLSRPWQLLDAARLCDLLSLLENGDMYGAWRHAP